MDNVGCHTSSVHFCISIQLHDKQNVNNSNNSSSLYIYRAVHICTALQEPSSYFILDSYSKVYVSVIISYWCILYPCLLGYIESLHIGVLFRQAEFPCLPPALTLTAPHIPQYRFLFSFTTFFLRRGKVHRYRSRYIQSVLQIQIPDPTQTKL